MQQLSELSATEVIRLLELEPLPFEGGFFRRSYTCERAAEGRSLASAIYYLVTRDNFSAWHRVASDELFHFYAGASVVLWRIAPGGELTRALLGTRFEREESPQALVPAGHWQALRLAGEGEWALLGTTVFPAFTYEDFELGERERLKGEFPEHGALIEQLTRG